MFGIGEQEMTLQDLIDSGMAWQLEGSIGREAMRCIESGCCMLGEVSHKDYWGSKIPSRHEVEAGTVGSPEYYEAAQGFCYFDDFDDE